MSAPHSALLPGCQSKPTVLRSPDANTSTPLPSRLARRLAARRGVSSTHTSHDEPTEIYSLPSGPCAIVRVRWPYRSVAPLGRSSSLRTGPGVPLGSKLLSCTSWSSAAAYSIDGAAPPPDLT